MVFDANLVLINGSVALVPTTDTPAVLTTREDTGGSVVVDLNTTTQPRGDSEGVMHLTATMILPTAPTTYADTLIAYIEQSDAVTFGWERIASFPTLYAYTKSLYVVSTTPFIYTDIGTTLNGTTTGDDGVIRWMSNDLLGAVGSRGYIIVTMVNATDDFDDLDEDFTTGGTGAGTMLQMPVTPTKPRLGGPNTFTRAFGVTKRYVRANLTVTTGGSFGAVQVLLSPYPFKTL